MARINPDSSAINRHILLWNWATLGVSVLSFAMKVRCLPALFVFAVAARAEITVTVSPNGPVTSLQGARDAIREQRKAGTTGHATISFEAGTYEQGNSVAFDGVDSDLTIKAAPGAKVTLVGAKKISDFRPYQGAILKADVSQIIAKGAKYRQLLFDGVRLPLARYPNVDASDLLYGGWAFVDEIPKAAVEGHQWKSEFYVNAKDVRHWEHPEDVELDIFAQYGWWNFIQPVKALDDATHKVTLAKPCSYDLHPHNRYHFQNALEELDAPGEWFLDPRTHILYVWPEDDVSKHEVRLVTLDSFLKLNPGTRGVSIERLTFTGCNGTAVIMANTKQCRVAACTFVTVGDFSGSAVSINGGFDNLAQGNDISFVGSTGISLSGGDRPTLTACNNVADNNHIHHIGVFNKNACGVGANGVGIIISHNLIHDGPRMGVQMGGNNITVEYNHMHHLVLETQDGGAVYTGGRDWIASRGSKWQYNRIHDIIGCGQEAGGLKHPWFTFGLYPDDNTGGVDIIGNLVYRIAHTPIHMHNSRDCVVENNVFAFGGHFQFDMHGWTKDQHYWIDHGPTMIKGYESVVNQPAWQSMRGMETHPKDAFHDDGTMMSGDIVRRNIMYSDEAGVKYGDLRNVSSKWNTIDQNLAWNGSHPVVTGVNKVGPDKGPALLVEDFSGAKNGSTPKGWGFNSKPNNNVKCVAQDGVLVVDAATSADPKNNHTTFHGPDIPMKPGAAFRVRLRAKSSGAAGKITLALAAFKNGAGYWQTGATNVNLTQEWREFEATGRMPLENDKNWKPWMTAFWLRVDCRDEQGQVFIDDVSVREAEPLNEWSAWQAEGWDKNGIVADPLFVDVEHDDFRLKPQSPAITKLGFKPLPIEQMGLYKDEQRASWPVQE